MTATGACGPLGLMTGDEEKKEGQGKQGVLWGQCPRAEGLSTGGTRRYLFFPTRLRAGFAF